MERLFIDTFYIYTDGGGIILARKAKGKTIHHWNEWDQRYGQHS